MCGFFDQLLFVDVPVARGLLTFAWWMFANVGGVLFLFSVYRFLRKRDEADRLLAGAFGLRLAGGIALWSGLGGWAVEAVDLAGWMVSPESLRIHVVLVTVGVVYLLTGWWMARYVARREREIAAERRALWAPPPAPVDNSAAERAEAGRFSREAERLLRAGGWYPGLRTDYQLDEFEFELHARAREFVREFSRVDFGFKMYVEPRLANMEYENFAAVAKLGLRNCVPLGGSYWSGEASIWMDEDGALYLGGGGQFDLLGRTTEEGIECVLLNKKMPGTQWMVEWVD